MDAKLKSTEVKCFSVTQECNYIGCDGNYKSLNLFYKEKAVYVHECTGCKELKLFDKQYPKLEYEEVEHKKDESEKAFCGQAVPDSSDFDFDDDIPF